MRRQEGIGNQREFHGRGGPADDCAKLIRGEVYNVCLEFVLQGSIGKDNRACGKRRARRREHRRLFGGHAGLSWLAG